jgi:Domain of unknown function (DUF4105)
MLSIYKTNFPLPLKTAANIFTKRRKLGFFVTILTLFCLFSTKTTAFPVSDSTRFSLITVAAGDELYSSFGHSAIRVQDTKLGIDRAFNWGTFDFSTPNFYVKFCRGQLMYFMNIERGRDFEYDNLVDKRPMQVQFLNLTLEQKTRLATLLTNNMKPENRFYKYDFFFDNCSTRIRDMLRETFFYTLNYDSTNTDSKKTLRQLLNPALASQPWTDFGIDLVLGMPADQKVTAENSMFLPVHLHDILATTKISENQPLLQKETFIGQPISTIKKSSFLDQITQPTAVLWFVFGLGLLSIWSPGFQVVFDRVFWFSLGVIGLIIAFLWFFTDHQATKNNLNIFWALPTHLLFFWRKAKSGLAEYHTILAAILAGLVVVFWKFLPQELPIAALPIALLVVAKGITNFKKMGQAIV